MYIFNQFFFTNFNQSIARLSISRVYNFPTARVLTHSSECLAAVPNQASLKILQINCRLELFVISTAIVTQFYNVHVVANILVRPTVGLHMENMIANIGLRN